MVFLGVWALFGLGTFARNQQRAQSSGTIGVGQVLIANSQSESWIPVALNAHLSRDFTSDNFAHIDLAIILGGDPPDEQHDEPSSEQVLGRIFAWLCTTLYLTSRLPQIWKNVRSCRMSPCVNIDEVVM
jgi:hypothetical protein